MNGWLGAAVGIAVMAGHTILRVVTHRLSRRSSRTRSLLVLELGGLGLRMVLLLGVVTLILAFTAVHKEAFAGTVLMLLVLSLVAELRTFWRRGAPDAPGHE